MATDKSQTSFSRGRRWKIGLDLFARTLLVMAVVVMANYFAAQFQHRFYLSAQTDAKLSSRTLTVLRSLTNHVDVILYYDRKDDFYPNIAALLNEYTAANPKISVRTVDWVRDAGEAEKIKEQYKQFFPVQGEKNLVIFDAGNNRVRVANGDELTQVKLEAVPNGKEREFRRKPIAFLGELAFTADLLALENPQPFKAYFLQGHGEPGFGDSDTRPMDYLKFASILRAENNIDVQALRLSGDTPVPMDCHLLIIAGPHEPFSDSELKKVNQYLVEGGRLFILFNYFSIKNPTGLEKITANWGINVRADTVRDLENHRSENDIEVFNFGQHPVVNPLTQSQLEMVLPRPVSEIKNLNPPPDAPRIDELAFSGTDSILASEPSALPRSYPLMAAVEQKNVAGIASPRGNMRMVVVGDSFFLDNQLADAAANKDFLGYAVNWLLDRPQLLEGIGPRPVIEYHLLMTERQERNARWLLLGALPGAVLLLGALVWFVRRK